jgi:hypothetical protein
LIWEHFALKISYIIQNRNVIVYNSIIILIWKVKFVITFCQNIDFSKRKLISVYSIEISFEVLSFWTDSNWSSIAKREWIERQNRENF